VHAISLANWPRRSWLGRWRRCRRTSCLVMFVVCLCQSVSQVAAQEAEILPAKMDAQLLYPYEDGAVSSDGKRLSMIRTHGEKDTIALLQFDSTHYNETSGRSVRRIALRAHNMVCLSGIDGNVPLLVGVLKESWSVDSIHETKHVPGWYDIMVLHPGDDPSKQGWREFELFPHPVINLEISDRDVVDRAAKNGIVLRISDYRGNGILHAGCGLDSIESAKVPQVVIEYSLCRNRQCAFLPNVRQ